MVSTPQSTQNQTLLNWCHTFPILKKVITGIFKPEPVQRFAVLFKKLMNEREKSGGDVKNNDILDMIIDWFERLDSPEMKKAGVNELSLICSALVFYFAGQDQLSTSTVIYHMTQDPELERRIYEEIDRVFEESKGKVEHENLHKLELLNSCVIESLRLYPFFHRAERVCTKDWENKEFNLKIKKGMTIQIPNWAINRCEDYNENGLAWDADRFMPGNREKLNPYSSTAFGHGPRNCTAQKWSTEAMSIILAYTLKDLKFKATKDTELTFVPGGPFFTPHEKIYVDVMERIWRTRHPPFKLD